MQELLIRSYEGPSDPVHSMPRSPVDGRFGNLARSSKDFSTKPNEVRVIEFNEALVSKDKFAQRLISSYNPTPPT